MNQELKTLVSLAGVLATLYLVLQIADRGIQPLTKSVRESSDLWITEGAPGKVL